MTMVDSGASGTSATATDRPSVYNFINDRHTDMRPKQLPTNHTFATKTKKGKQVGKQPKGEGVIYFMVSASNAVTADDSEWVAVKVGLASGGEAEAFKVLGNHRTSNDGDTYFHALLTVCNVGKAEADLHSTLQEMGYSTLHGMDHSIPDAYRKFYTQQQGGGEWFVLPLSVLEAVIADARQTMREPHVWADGWIGQSHTNAPVKFHYDSEGMPRCEMQGRMGRPVEENALAFAYAYRTLTGFAPEGCCLA